MKIIGKILVWIFIATAALLVVSVLPIPGGIKSYVVLSGSMQPAIQTGSVVFIIPAKPYHIGDVVTFGEVSKIQAPTTHRIVDTRLINGEQFFTTKGDANNARDAKEITAGDIQGKVFLTIPFLGYGVNLGRNPIVFISIIVICAGLIIFDQAKNIWGELKKEENRPEEKKEDKQ